MWDEFGVMGSLRAPLFFCFYFTSSLILLLFLLPMYGKGRESDLERMN